MQERTAHEQREVLRALRLARVDYVLVRPFGDDRICVCLSAALATLQAHAEEVELLARLRDFPGGLERQLHECAHCMPRAPFKLDSAADFCVFRSKERCELLFHLLEASARRRARPGGARFNGVLKDFFLLHHLRERALTYEVGRRPRRLAVVRAARVAAAAARALHVRDAATAPRSGQLLEYAGERRRSSSSSSPSFELAAPPHVPGLIISPGTGAAARKRTAVAEATRTTAATAATAAMAAMVAATGMARRHAVRAADARVVI